MLHTHCVPYIAACINNVDDASGRGVCAYASNDDVYVVLRMAANAGGNGNVSTFGSAGVFSGDNAIVSAVDRADISTMYIQSLSVVLGAGDAACGFSPMNYPPG